MFWFQFFGFLCVVWLTYFWKILETKEMNVDLRCIDLSSLYLYFYRLTFSLTCLEFLALFSPQANAIYVCLAQL